MSTAVVIPTLDPDSPMCADAVKAVEDTTQGVEIVVEWDSERAGFAHTCNAGAARTTADTLVFLNDDTITQPGWLSELRPYVGFGVAGSLLLYPDGTTQHSGVFLRRRGPLLEAYNRKRPAQTCEVPAVTGACLAIGREWWDRVGGFCEDYLNGYEDVDLCLRVREAGGQVWFVSTSEVVHLESRSDPELRFGSVRENVELLQRRWGGLPI